MSGPEGAAPRRYGARYYLKRTMIYLASGYLLLCAFLFFFQKSFIYQGTKDASVDPARAGLAAGQARGVTLKTEDGVALGAWQTLPRTPAFEGKFDEVLKNGSGPVDLFFHGNAGHRGHRADLYVSLGGMGLPVLAPDYRGYGDSEGSASEEGLARDARAAWDWLVKEKGVAPARIILHGESLGCAVAVRLAREQCEAGYAPAALVLEAPFTRLADVAARSFWFVPTRLIVTERFPSIDRIGGITCPIVIFHGRKDPVVPFEQGRALFEAAPAASSNGSAKVFVELPLAGHNDLRSTGWLAYSAAWKDLLARIGEPAP